MSREVPMTMGRGGAAPNPTPPTPMPAPTVLDPRNRVSARLRRLGVVGAALDRFVTLVSGLAPTGAKPMWTWNRPTMYAMVLLWLFGGAAASAAILQAPWMWWLLLPVTLMFTAGGARAAMLTIMHDAIHMTLEHRDEQVRRRYRAIGRFLSRLLVVQNFDSYAEGHRPHHGKEFATIDDPDVRFILALGFKPGMTVDELWKRYRTLRWSPWFHWTYLRYRVMSHLEAWGTTTNEMVVMFLLVTILGLLLLPGWTIFTVLVAWVLPVTILFQQAALEQFLGEHRWLAHGIAGPVPNRRFALAELSAGRFAVDAPPSLRYAMSLRVILWIGWWTRLLFRHLPFRVRVVAFDLAHHDEHHLHGLNALRSRGVVLPKWANWMNTAYARRLYETHRGPQDPPLISFFDRAEPLEATFRAFAALPPMAMPKFDAKKLGGGMLGM